MEYIIVKVKQKDSIPAIYWLASNGSKITLPVIINGEKNGFIGKILEIESGTTEIAVLPVSKVTHSEVITINLTPNSTSIKNPKEVIINVL